MCQRHLTTTQHSRPSEAPLLLRRRVQAEGLSLLTNTAAAAAAAAQ